MKCLKPNMIVEGKFKHFNQKILEQNPESFIIPCGHCLSCKMNKAREWSAKCVFESYIHKYNYFLTLTYEDQNLTFKDKNYIDLTGELRAEPTLVKKDLQNFIKRLRKRHWLDYNKWNTLKYLACGEYGEITKRPHYHMILFSDYPIPDLTQFKRNHDKDILFTSNYLDRIWGFGFTTIAEFTPATAGYVARYTIKKLYGSTKKEYLKAGIYNKEPEFLLCSKKPALGYAYFDQNKDLYLKTDNIYFYNKEKLVSSKLPKSWVLKCTPDQQKIIVDQRKKNTQRNYINYLNVNNEKNYLNLLAKEKLIVNEKAKKLIKSSI